MGNGHMHAGFSMGANCSGVKSSRRFKNPKAERPSVQPASLKISFSDKVCSLCRQHIGSSEDVLQELVDINQPFSVFHASCIRLFLSRLAREYAVKCKADNLFFSVKMAKAAVGPIKKRIRRIKNKIGSGSEVIDLGQLEEKKAALEKLIPQILLLPDRCRLVRCQEIIDWQSAIKKIEKDIVDLERQSRKYSRKKAKNSWQKIVAEHKLQKARLELEKKKILLHGEVSK